MNDQFKSLAQQICAFFLEEGILIRPYSNSQLRFFSTLPQDEQKSILADISTYQKICAAMAKRKNSLKDTRLFTKEALLQLDLRADEKHLEVIENHHLVEIYNLNHTQIFRSFRFFEVSSYTLEDIYCRKWWHLYERSPADEALIQKIVGDFINSSEKTICHVDMPEHFIKEKDTLEHLVVKTQLHWLIPLYRGDQLAAMMAIETSHL